MDDTKLYEELAKYLDQGVVGAPMSPALIEILKILFPGEEAEIALTLPLQNTSLSDLKDVFPDRVDTIEKILNQMAKRGTVFKSQRPGQDARYRLLPSIVGWAETPFWAGKDTPDARKLAPLWIKYRDEAFGAELARGEMPVMRVIPVSKALKDESEILPFDVIKPKLDNVSYFAVGNCPCRLMQKFTGKGCDHTLENCLHFGTMGRYMVEQGMARKLTREETLKILAEADEEGLVHIVDNLDGYMSTICNCCECCCIFLDTQKRLGLNVLSSSNYVARVDSEACIGCGNCEERCPMDAITLGNEEAAEIDEKLCIGCGVCTPTCSEEAVALKLREEVKPPPEFSDFVEKRFKAM